MEKDDVSKETKSVADTERLSRTFPFRVRTSAYNFEPERSLILKDDSTVIYNPRCFPNNGIDLSGGSVTDSSGRMTWMLSNFVCPENVPERGFAIDFPVSFVATPQSDKPCYMTAKFIVPLVPNDVIFEVYSWNSKGESAPSTPFYWRCRIPLTFIIT
jgi:hypothetical protein